MKRNTLLVVVGGVAVAGVAFGAGLLVQRQLTGRLVEGVVSSLGLLAEAPPPPIATWIYPGATVKSNLSGTRASVQGVPVNPYLRVQYFVTADPYEDVVSFYNEKAGFGDSADGSLGRSGIGSSGRLGLAAEDAGRDPGEFVWVPHGTRPEEGDRPLRASCLVRRGPGYGVTLSITRADDEEHSHVVLVYDTLERAGEG